MRAGILGVLQTHRLRDVQGLGGPAEVQLLRDGDEIAQLARSTSIMTVCGGTVLA